MARNVEIKARITDWDEMLRRAASLADGEPVTLKQEDIFFHVPRGRLKLRTVNGAGELIYYLRSDETGPKQSDYLRLPVSNPESARQILATIYGERAAIRKTRLLYMAGQTRIHLDRVEGLGDFLELEVVLQDDQSSEAGVKIAQDLMARLGMTADQLVDRAYVDLLPMR